MSTWCERDGRQGHWSVLRQTAGRGAREGSARAQTAQRHGGYRRDVTRLGELAWNLSCVGKLDERYVPMYDCNVLPVALHGLVYYTTYVHLYFTTSKPI